MRQVLMILTAESCRECFLSAEDTSFYFCIAGEQMQSEEICLYQKEGVWSFCADAKGFLKPTSGAGSTGFRMGEQKIWEYTDQSGKRLVFLTFAKKLEETRFQYYTVEEKEEITIGKGRDNTISYDCMGLVSNRHAVAKWRNGTWEINDTSKNGVFLDEKRIHMQTELVYGDCIEIFGLKIVFLGRIIGVENRENMHVRMEKYHWQEPDERRQRKSVLWNGMEMVERMEPTLPEEEVGQGLQRQMVCLCGNREQPREGREDSTLFLAVGPIRVVYAGRQRKKQRAQEKQEFVRWRLEQTEKIAAAYERERKNWLRQHRNIWEWSDTFRSEEEIWQTSQRDTLWVTWGTGRRKSEIVYSMEQLTSGKEREEIETSVESHRWQEQVPVGINLLHCRQLEIVGETAWQMLQGILIQIAASIPYTKLRIVCLAKKENPVTRAIRWLPHVWSDAQDCRYYAIEKAKVPRLFSNLEKEKEQRHTLVLVEEREWLREIEWQHKWVKDKYSFWFLVDKQKNCSDICGQRLVVWNNFAAFFKGETLEQEFVPHYLEEGQWKEWLRRINSLRIRKLQQTSVGEVGLFHVYTREKREIETVLGRWKRNRTREGICAYLGMDEKETPAILDIHEKQQGPHGLIAGTTGAGKSILLQTFVLSLAMEYSPEQLEFVLIDYKGGDMAAPLSELPHVVGTLTNLQPQLLKRGLSAIQSEIERRQRLLAEKQFFHIDCYNQQMESVGGRSVPHLCIVVDEFAELTTDAPYFLEGLLKVSRVGRSLGIHLILATQRPTGTVTPHIWANSKFRLCLMVQSEQDSLEMLHREDAAGITTPGEAFLQVGTDNTLNKIRVAHAQALVGTDNGVIRLLEDGTKMEGNKERTNMPTQREALVCLLSECARESGVEKTRKLWLPLLSSRITHTQKQEWKETCIWLGWCDVPKQQRQIPLLIEEMQFGNIAVLGEVGRGKTTCLKNILWELCHNQFERERWIFLCDFDREFGDKRELLPWTGAVVRTAAEFEKLLHFLSREYERRREQPQNQYPMLWVLIDHMEAMRKQTRDWYTEELSMFVREGKKYKIYFVFLAQSYGMHGIPSAWKPNVTHQLVFSENSEEKKNCYPQMELPECTSHCPGRGVTKVGETIVEFQGVYVEQGEYRAWFQTASKEERESPFVLLPEILDYDTFVKMEKKCSRKGMVSIGCKEFDGSVCQLPLQGMEQFLIVGKQAGDCDIPLCTFLTQLKRKDVSCLLFGKDQSASVRFAKKQGIPVVTESKWEKENIHIEAYSWVFLEDFSNWLEKLGDWIFENIHNNRKTVWVGACQADEFRVLRKYPAFRHMCERQQGIYLGSGIREQSFFDTGILPKSWENYMDQQEIGLLFWHKKMQLVHFPNVDV